MGIGPFTTYVPPGVYTNTIVAADGASGAAGLRIPVFVGVGEETYTVRNLEVVRGSSSKADVISNREDMTGRFVDPDTNALVAANGEISVVRVRNIPITSGDGTGNIANAPSQVKVRINGEAAGVARVDGALGEIYIAQVVLAADVVDVTYYWHRGDSLIELEDHSALLAKPVAVGAMPDDIVSISTFYGPIVTSTGDGAALAGAVDVGSASLVRIFTNSDIDEQLEATAQVYGSTSLIELKLSDLIPTGTAGVWGEVDDVLQVTGSNITLGEVFSELKVSYWTNTWQDTFDPLPNKNVVEIIGQGVGLNPNKTTDFAEGQSFVNEGDQLHWGSSFLIAGGVHTPKKEYFDDTQVKVALHDSYFVNDVLVPVDADGDGMTDTWAMTFEPVDGSGYGRVTRDLTKIQVDTDGLAEVIAINGKNIILSEPIDVDEEGLILASYHYNQLRDESYTVTVVDEGAAGVGTFSLASTFSGAPAHAVVNLDETSVADSGWSLNELWLEDGSDLQTMPKYSKSEQISVTFIDGVNFNVTSSISGGTSGSGRVGRTFYNKFTGVRFTIADSGLYASGDVIVIDVTSNPNYDTGTEFILDLPGIKLQVLNTLDCGEGDTAIVKTFNKSGPEPKIGEFYYVSYKYTKEDFSPKVFTKIKAIEAEYGNISIKNKLSLAAYLAFLNGATAVGFKQVLKSPGKDDSSGVAYINGIVELEKKIEGVYNADLVVPLTTLGDVQAFAKAHVEKMSSERFQGERMTFLGCPLGTTPVKAQLLAKGLASSRVVLLYPDGVVLGILDEMGMENEYLVDGSMLAAALAGKVVSPQYDEATDMTRKELVGFKRLSRVLDSVEANQTAVAGVTILEDLRPSIRIRQWFTTDMASVLTRTPYVTQVIDKVQKDARASLDSFIGRKNLPSLVPDMKASLANTLQSLVANQLVAEFSGVDVQVSPLDPTIILAEAFYKPVFSVAWVRITFNVRA
jgi:hypothetical protein